MSERKVHPAAEVAKEEGVPVAHYEQGPIGWRWCIGMPDGSLWGEFGGASTIGDAMSQAGKVLRRAERSLR